MVLVSQLEDWDRLTSTGPLVATPGVSCRSSSAPLRPRDALRPSPEQQCSASRSRAAVGCGALGGSSCAASFQGGGCALDRTVAASYVSRRQSRLHGALDVLAEEQARSSRGLLSSSLARSLPSLGGRRASAAESPPAFSPEELSWTAPSWQARSGLNSRWYPHPVHSRGNLQLSKPGLLELGVDPLHDRVNKCPMWDGGNDRFVRNASMPEAKPRTPQNGRVLQNQDAWADRSNHKAFRVNHRCGPEPEHRDSIRP